MYFVFCFNVPFVYYPSFLLPSGNVFCATVGAKWRNRKNKNKKKEPIGYSRNEE